MNNIELIKPLLEFTSKDSFYFLQILQRKKEHPELGRNSNVIKNYYIDSVEYLERKMDEIINLCNFFNAKAMLRLTPRSYKKTALDNLNKLHNVYKMKIIELFLNLILVVLVVLPKELLKDG